MVLPLISTGHWTKKHVFPSRRSMLSGHFILTSAESIMRSIRLWVHERAPRSYSAHVSHSAAAKPLLYFGVSGYGCELKDLSWSRWLILSPHTKNTPFIACFIPLSTVYWFLAHCSWGATSNHTDASLTPPPPLCAHSGWITVCSASGQQHCQFTRTHTASLELHFCFFAR